MYFKNRYTYLPLLYLLFICFFKTYSQAPAWNWSSGWAAGNADIGRGVYVDSLGYTYQVGAFSSSVISLPSLGNLINSGAAGSNDIMIAKFDQNGTPLWQVKAGGAGDDIANCVTADKFGNIYVAGSIKSSSCVFYGSTNFTITAGANNDFFIAKYNSSGSVQWVKTGSSSGNDEILSITNDNNFVYVAGYFTSTISIPTSTLITSNGGEDMLLAKYDVNGNLVWAAKEGGAGNDRCNAITNNVNNLFIGGFAGNGITYYGSVNIVNPPVTALGDDITFACINKNANVLWAKSEGNNSPCNATSIALVKGKVIVGGSYVGNLNYNSILLASSGGNEMFFAEYDLPGNFIAVRGFYTAGDEVITGLAGDSKYIYVTGKYANSVDFGNGTPVTASSSSNLFVACYDTTSLLNYQFAKFATSTSTNQALSISSNVNGFVSLTGSFNGSNIQFAPLAANSSSASEDFYVANFSNCLAITGNSITGNQTICSVSTPTSLNGSLPLGGNNTYNYLWQQSIDGITWLNAPGTNSLINYSSPSSLTVTTYFKRNITSCSELSTSNQLTITVNANPTITAVASSSAICSGATATLTANGANTYTWTSGPASSIYTVNAAGVYTVTGADINNCTNTQTVNLFVNSSPNITATGSSSVICPGGTATLTASGANTYTWTSGPASAIYTVNTAGVYTVTGVGTNNCAGTQTVSLLPSSNPTVTAVSSSSVICSGATATLTASGATTYSWTSGPASAVFTVNAGGVYTVTGVDINNCTNTQTVSLLLNSSPTLAVIASSSAICSGTTATLTASGANTYNWTNGPANTNYIVDAGGVYTVTGISLNNCTDTKTINLIVNSLPVIAINSGTICNGTSFTLFPTGAINYTYSSFSNVVAPSVTASYTVVGQDVNNCVNNGVATIVVDQPPTIANAGSDIETSAPKVSLNGNIPSIGLGQWSLLSGYGEFSSYNDPSGIFTNIKAGKNSLLWTIRNGSCPETSDTLVINRKEFIIPQLITPNNDGDNDVLYFNVIEYTNNVKIEIFDRWGALVYKNDDYKNDFDGKKLNGDELLDDTYFVILNIPNENTYTSYLTIKRK